MAIKKIGYPPKGGGGDFFLIFFLFEGEKVPYRCL